MCFRESFLRRARGRTRPSARARGDMCVGGGASQSILVRNKWFLCHHSSLCLCRGCRWMCRVSPCANGLPFFPNTSSVRPGALGSLRVAGASSERVSRVRGSCTDVAAYPGVPVSGNKYMCGEAVLATSGRVRVSHRTAMSRSFVHRKLFTFPTCDFI